MNHALYAMTLGQEKTDDHIVPSLAVAHVSATGFEYVLKISVELVTCVEQRGLPRAARRLRP